MQRPKGTVLLVEDTETVSRIVSSTMRERGYKVVTVASGEEAFGAVQLSKPDLILLDINLPDMDGYQICKRLKADPLFHHVPVVMVTSMDQTGFEIMALEAGADDFVHKPIDPVVLDARMNMIISRSRRERFANPLSGLPGGVLVEQRVASAFESGKPFALVSFDIDYFKRFNDRYGYPRGDEVLLRLAGILTEAAGFSCALNAAPTATDPDSVLVGHVSADDFVCVCPPEKARSIAERVVEEFDAVVGKYYDEEDRERGSIRVKNRKGEDEEYPLMSLSVVIVSSADRTYWSPLEMMDTAAELKAYAKKQQGSVIVEDRRQDARPAASGAVEGEA